MSKHPNPVRGFVPCPVCQTVSTVHQVGEGKLMAEGEPPKNGRNLGLKYYRCSRCGNSSMSKSVNEYVENHMAEHESDLLTTVVDDVLTVVDDVLTVESVEQIVPIEVSQGKVDSTELTEPESKKTPVTQKPFFTVKRVLMVLGVLLALLWAVRMLMPKPELKEAGNVATE